MACNPEQSPCVRKRRRLSAYTWSQRPPDPVRARGRLGSRRSSASGRNEARTSQPQHAHHAPRRNSPQPRRANQSRAGCDPRLSGPEVQSHHAALGALLGNVLHVEVPCPQGTVASEHLEEQRRIRVHMALRSSPHRTEGTAARARRSASRPHRFTHPPKAQRPRCAPQPPRQQNQPRSPREQG